MPRSLLLNWIRCNATQGLFFVLLLSLLWPASARAGQFDIQPYLRAVQPVNPNPAPSAKSMTDNKSAVSASLPEPSVNRPASLSQMPESAPVPSLVETAPAPKESFVAFQQPGKLPAALSTQLSLATQASNIGEPAAADELVAEGDQLVFSVFGQPDLSADLLVGESGVITLPLVGTLEVKAKTVQQIASMVTQKLEQGQYLRNPKVSVKLIQQQSRSFSVLGEVLRPGRYPLSSSLSVLDGLSLAGGMTAKADKQVRLLRRSSKQVNSELIEYAAVRLELENGAVPEQLAQKLRPNDILFVAQQKSFYIYGEVRKPGMYPIEDDLNVMRVLSIGGGVTERGSARRIVIHRKAVDGKLHEIPAQITDKVEPGDVVYVNERIF